MNNQLSASGELISKIRELLRENVPFRKIQKLIFEELRKSNVKAEFALDLIYSMNPADVVVPNYIDEGLSWLESCLCTEE